MYETYIMSAPTITIVDGIGTWTADPLPYVWLLAVCFADGSNVNINASTEFDGSIVSKDFTYYGGGFYLKLTGLDANGNIMYTPTLSGPCPEIVY